MGQFCHLSLLIVITVAGSFLLSTVDAYSSYNDLPPVYDDYDDCGDGYSGASGIGEALRKLFATIILVLRYILTTTCETLYRLFQSLYNTLDCILEIAQIDVCSLFYSCETGILDMSEVQCDDEGSKYDMRYGYKGISSNGIEMYPISTSDWSRPDIWAGYLFVLLERVVEVPHRILGMAPLIFCPWRRYPQEHKGISGAKLACRNRLWPGPEDEEYNAVANDYRSTVASKSGKAPYIQ